MKLLFFVDDFIGGAGNVIQLLAKELQSRGYEVFIALTRQSTQPRRNLAGISFFALNESWKTQNSLQRNICLVKNIKKTLKDISPDVAISFLFGVSSLVGICCPTNKIPLIVAERSNPLAIQPSLPWKILRRHAYKKASAVVLQFDAFKPFDGGRYIRKAISIPNPVEQPVSYHSREAKSDGYYRFVTLGNDRPVKGFSYLITGLKKALSKHNNIRLEIYGQSISADNSALIQELGLSEHVSLKGYTNDIDSALNKNDFYIMPSLQEGFPNSLCEAMAMGMPCAAALCHDGIGELINNGVNGITFAPSSSDAVADAILLLVENPDKAKEMGNAARSISEEYSLSGVTALWEKLL